MIEKQKCVRIPLEDFIDLPWIGILVGCAAQRNTFRFRHGVDAQTERDDQGCNDRHAVAGRGFSTLMRDGSSWAQSTTC